MTLIAYCEKIFLKHLRIKKHKNMFYWKNFVNGPGKTWYAESGDNPKGRSDSKVGIKVGFIKPGVRR